LSSGREAIILSESTHRLFCRLCPHCYPLTPTDLQAFIYLLTRWPASAKDRPAGKSAREILADNADMTAKLLKFSALRDGYMSRNAKSDPAAGSCRLRG
jgi:hypothetical protein